MQRGKKIFFPVWQTQQGAVEEEEEGDMEEYLEKWGNGKYRIKLRKRKGESEAKIEEEEEREMEEYLAKGEDGRYYIEMREKKKESED